MSGGEASWLLYNFPKIFPASSYHASQSFVNCFEVCVLLLIVAKYLFYNFCLHWNFE